MNKSDFRIIEKPTGNFYVQRVFEDMVKVGVWPFRKKAVKISWSYLDEYGRSTPSVPTRIGRHTIISPKSFKTLKAAYKWIDQFCTPVKYHYPVEVHYKSCFPDYPKADSYPPEFPKDRLNAGS